VSPHPPAHTANQTIHSHRQIEQLLRGFNAAYNARRKRVLDGKTPDQVVAEGLKAKRILAKGKPLAPVHATPPRHASSRKPPRRSRNQTSKRFGVVPPVCLREQPGRRRKAAQPFNLLLLIISVMAVRIRGGSAAPPELRPRHGRERVDRRGYGRRDPI